MKGEGEEADDPPFRPAPVAVAVSDLSLDADAALEPACELADDAAEAAEEAEEERDEALVDSRGRPARRRPQVCTARACGQPRPWRAMPSPVRELTISSAGEDGMRVEGVEGARW